MVDPVRNLGRECLANCANREGPCMWCGRKGMCCKTVNDFINHSHEYWHFQITGCDGTVGGQTPTCVAIKETESRIKIPG